MKPISIMISAFGPYKDDVYVDFTKFNGNGIFLITGDTGSGKTTIFDAICFALFGTASGSNRGKNSFRSDFASDQVKTFVVLEFLHKGITYRIERNPSYMRKKKRGEGYTQVSGDATMMYIDEVITGDKNVTDKCVEILGINAMQFKQISMIAQGEFLKLLLSKPGERADIFRRIFDTYIYKNISDCLKKRYLELKRKYEDFGVIINNLKNSVMFDEYIEIDDFNVSDFLKLISKVMCKDEELEDKLEEKKTKFLNRIQKITSDISNASLINSNFDKYDTCKKKLEIKLRDKSEIDNKKLLLAKNRDIMDKILPFYNEVVKIDNLIKDKEIELFKNKALSEKLNVSYNKLLDKYKKLDLDRKKLDNLKLNLSELEKKIPLFLELDKLNSELLEKKNIYNLLKIEELSKIIEKFDYIKIINDKYLKEKSKFIEIKNKYNELFNKYNLKYNNFISCQAGLIAKELKENCPCPVCGSVNHPCKAMIEGEYVTKEELDSLRDELDRCQDKLEKVSNDVSSLKRELEISNNEIDGIDIDEIKETISEYRGNITKNVSVSEYNINDILMDISYIEASVDSKSSLINDGDTEKLVRDKIKEIALEMERINKYIDDINNEYEKVSKQKASIESIIKVQDNEIVDLKKSKILKNNEYVNSYKNLGYEKEDDYLDLKLDKDLYSKYEDKVSNYDNEIVDLGSKIKALEDIINNNERIDISDLVEEKSTINNKLSEVELSLKNVNNKINNNKLVYNKLSSLYKKIEKLEEELAIVEDLSNTANGNIRGKNKLEFEQYVQASYFDNVLVSANKRFSYMTDSRYLLSRKLEATKVSDKLGLELEVIDNYTGKRREITSLSGGESFKASLSLALGMSDVIQSYSGGIVVETMFIDEGFGSLDSESLEAAMNAIIMLSSNDRLIGIISHVNELKDRIDKKIVVKKSSNGSKVEIVV